ncbi:hypothetical protein [Flavobacterium sp. HNIBRBA15423]|uniref:hypothetical protein n=1 Tax=Flavobacterium sp. HNIBRBA15423 TaxID=3458683 RepID=UPI0040450071
MMILLKKIKKKLRNLFISPSIFPKNEELKKIFSSFERAIVLGSSESINNLDITLFKNDFVITMGNFYEHPEIEIINPKVHVFAASHSPITEKVLKCWWGRCNDILPKSTILLIEKRDEKIAKEIFTDRKIFFYSYGGSLPVDLTKRILSPWSVTVVGIQLAIYCKIPKIILLGVNHDWQCIQKYTHFYEHDKPSLEYYLKKENIKISYEEQKQPFPKERLYREYELYQQYESLKEESIKLGLQIVNGDPFSFFDVFPFDKQKQIIKS